ncbi:MAG: 4-hydroxythreonine-4-phosphate dehydrogenase PdxA [Tannerellaceae bacterium]|jgi:4-hydroxythreonine-4-phosphate dehydrogenase|nr:4-hydroxythreonine-4-phosphate dehydrogenase PdxA [Tannerellaceae bacterium]
MEDRMIKVGITHGDVNGIGYEIILKAFSDTRMTEFCIPIIYGSSKIAAYHRKALELPSLNISSIVKAEDAGINRVSMINCIGDEVKVELSRPTEVSNEAAFKALEVAAADLKRGAIDVLVTAPVSTSTATPPLPMPAEYLEKAFARDGKTSLPVLVSEDLRVALATGNIPFPEVLPKITKKNIVEKLEAFCLSLKQDFGIIRPRIAVLSLNPHTVAGGGIHGDEEVNIIMPAMREAEKHGVMSFGPYASDNFFGGRLYEKFDGVLAMYYDQGAAPFETLASEGGLCYTAGLSVVHTSPAHGAAYEIAGQNIASEDSLRQAVYVALDICRNRRLHKEATRNPLRKQYFDKGAGDESVDLTKEDDAATI